MLYPQPPISLIHLTSFHQTATIPSSPPRPKKNTTHLLPSHRILHQNQTGQSRTPSQAIQIRQLSHIITRQNQRRQIWQGIRQRRWNAWDAIAS